MKANLYSVRSEFFSIEFAKTPWHYEKKFGIDLTMLALDRVDIHVEM